MVKERDISIDILKFIAALIITNSHMDLLYGDYSMFATGGAIGDALFFFCSGYTLFLDKKNIGFFNWYKKRISRIYPTIFAWTLLASIMSWCNWQERNMFDVVVMGGGWFVSCIMIYYFLLWFVKSFLLDKLRYVFGLSVFLVYLWYFCVGIDDCNGSNNMYGFCYFKWCHYFLFMLFGSMLGLNKLKKDFKDEGVNKVSSLLLKLFVSIILFYTLFYFKNKGGICYDMLQVASLFPLICVCYYSYLLCDSPFFKRLYKKRCGVVIKFIGGLCLEIYLVQFALFTDRLNSIFPFNLIVIFLLILVVAYLLRCVSRLWSQTFKDSDYDWNLIFKMY